MKLWGVLILLLPLTAKADDIKDILKPFAGSKIGIVSTQENKYKVHILGEVTKPGRYDLNPGMRLDEAVKIAGGTNGIGSLAMIQLKRNDKVECYNLVEYYKGNLNQNPFLSDNDVIFIPNPAEIYCKAVRGSNEVLSLDTSILPPSESGGTLR